MSGIIQSFKFVNKRPERVGHPPTSNTLTGVTASYLYDADGRRIRKTTSNGGTVDFLYDLGGHEVSQITAAGSWTRGEIYAGGRHLGTYSGGTSGTTTFTFSDWLGTERARSVPGATTTCETITSLPFGDGMTTTGSCGDPSPMHFTGKERDSESGLDNFGARYDSSQYGRFMTPDWAAKPMGVPYADFGDPQTLNLYSYVRNNPLSRADINGHCWKWAQSFCNWANYGVWGDEKAVQAAETTARNQLSAQQQMRAANGQSPLIFNTGQQANGHPILTTDVSQMSRNAVFDTINSGHDVTWGGQIGLVGGLVLYRGGGFEAGPKDYRLDAQGNVQTGYGISVNTDPSKIPQRFQGNIRIFNESDLPPELRAIQRGARDPGHFEITPRDSGMSPQRYQELLNAFGKELEEDPE